MFQGFIDLPVDVLLDVCKFLGPTDLFVLNLTCRALHDLCCIDDVWKQIAPQWPLDIPTGKTVRNLSGDELRKLFVKSLEFDSRWRGDNFTPVKVFKGKPSHQIIDVVHLLTSQWLLTVGSKPDGSEGRVFTLWSLHDPNNIHAVCSQEASSVSYYESAAAWQRSGNQVIIFSHKADNMSVQVHSMDLREGVWEASELFTIPEAWYPFKTSGFHIQEHIVAWCCHINGRDRTVWIVNTQTKRCFSTSVSSPFDKTTIQLPVARITPDLTYLVLIAGHWNNNQREVEQVVHVYRIPPELSDDIVSSMENLAVEHFELGPAIALYKSPYTAPPSVIESEIFSRHASLDQSSNLVIVQLRHGGDEICITQFDISNPSREIRLVSQTYFPSNEDQSVELLCRSGRRGFLACDAFTSRNWYRFSCWMGNVEIHGNALLAENLFDGYHYTSFDFDDVAGRMCVATWGVYDGVPQSRLVISDYI